MYVLFGAGKYGLRILHIVGKENVAFFVDNDVEKHGKELQGIKIYSLEKKANEMKDYKIIISVNDQYSYEIEEQLKRFDLRPFLSMSEQLYLDYDAYCEGKKDYSLFLPDDSEKYWGDMETFTTKEMFPEQYINERKLIFEDYLPLLPQDAYLADVGCAGGDWTREVAAYVRHVDGFDYSEKMIKTAQGKAVGIDNVNFYCSDIREHRLEKKYDGLMLLGVLMYMFREEKVFDVLMGARDVLTDGGVLVTKDTITTSYDRTVYTYNPLNGYSGCYFPKQIYFEQFKRAGFSLINEYVLMKRQSGRNGNGGISLGAIWKKN